MAGGGGGEGELNLVPYMDIMLNLVMFMLVITVQDFQMAEILTPASRASSAGAGAAASPDNKKDTPKPVMRIVVDANQALVVVKNPVEGVDALSPFVARAPEGEKTLNAKNWADVGTYAADVVTKYGPKGPGEYMDVRMVVDPSVPYQEVIHGFDALREACLDPSKRSPDPEQNKACGPVPITTVVLETKSNK